MVPDRDLCINRVKPGDRYGRWTVVGTITRYDSNGKKASVRCRCICGHEEFVEVWKFFGRNIRIFPDLGCKKRACLNAYRSQQALSCVS